MRPLLTTEEIKKVFKRAFNEINDSNDDILSWEETYKTFIQIQKESLDFSSIQDLAHEDKFKEIVKKFNLKDKDDERKDIVLTTESKKELEEVINNKINTLIELQKKLNENIIDFIEVKDTVFKTEYFLFKLKCTF